MQFRCAPSGCEVKQFIDRTLLTNHNLEKNFLIYCHSTVCSEFLLVAGLLPYSYRELISTMVIFTDRCALLCWPHHHHHHWLVILEILSFSFSLSLSLFLFVSVSPSRSHLISLPLSLFCIRLSDSLLSPSFSSLSPLSLSLLSPSLSLHFMDAAGVISLKCCVLYSIYTFT